MKMYQLTEAELFACIYKAIEAGSAREFLNSSLSAKTELTTDQLANYFLDNMLKNQKENSHDGQ